MKIKTKNLNSINKMGAKKRRDVREKITKTMESISKTINKCSVHHEKKKKLFYNFQNALVLRQKVHNSIIKLEEDFLQTKLKMVDFVKKQNIEIIRLKNAK